MNARESESAGEKGGVAAGSAFREDRGACMNTCGYMFVACRGTCSKWQVVVASSSK